jgi:phospholipid/cholesterol/gamma-HCH transport system substrate-binding protein
VRRILAIAAVLAAAGTLFVVTAAGGSDGSGGSYEVRAIFDNGGFIVNGEDVRVAGANVGSVQSVDVSMPGEIVSLRGGPHAVPGKAVVVLNITDPGFQDFRRDATCLIRPQSLIGEKYVDCRPTAPRAPGTPPPPPLKQIPDGQPGSGQYLLPLENNGKAVDLDLIQNINRLPYAERFRLILNDLGAGFAARGPDIRQIVRKADPALRETDDVLRILAEQNRQLAQLARNSDTVLQPLARERGHLTGFIRSSGATAAATAEVRGPFAENIRKLPETLRQVRLTMKQLGGFSDAARPVFSVLGAHAPAITTATRRLAPFSSASTLAIKDLARNSEPTGRDLRRADPVVLKLRGLATAAQRPVTNLSKLTASLHKQGGFESLMRFIYYSAGALNGLDQYGHYLRTNILISSCIEYQTFPFADCPANFSSANSSGRRAFDPQQILKRFDQANNKSGGTLATPKLNDSGATTGLAPSQKPPLEPSTPPTGATGATGPSNRAGLGGNVGVLDYLLGP